MNNNTPITKIEQIIEAIDDRPLRWEVITLESALSLPTLSIVNGKVRAEFFFYPVGGNIGHRQIWPPSYRVTCEIDRLQEIVFQPLLAEELSTEISTELQLGIEINDGRTRDEYDLLLAAFYQNFDRLMEIFPQSIANLSSAERQAAIDFDRYFHQLVQPAIAPVYTMLNPDFFHWLS